MPFEASTFSQTPSHTRGTTSRAGEDEREEGSGEEGFSPARKGKRKLKPKKETTDWRGAERGPRLAGSDSTRADALDTPPVPVLVLAQSIAKVRRTLVPIPAARLWHSAGEPTGTLHAASRIAGNEGSAASESQWRLRTKAGKKGKSTDASRTLSRPKALTRRARTMATRLSISLVGAASPLPTLPPITPRFTLRESVYPAGTQPLAWPRKRSLLESGHGTQRKEKHRRALCPDSMRAVQPRLYARTLPPA
ncbi:hypothetical protein B0H13DRAFT_2400805 [Mycena leptocephala]|nr:hypothetical protein B0H13DRAFT_2400805 [Mycena leptocephala]